jgi:hypothetical protein
VGGEATPLAELEGLDLVDGSRPRSDGSYIRQYR